MPFINAIVKGKAMDKLTNRYRFCCGKTTFPQKREIEEAKVWKIKTFIISYKQVSTKPEWVCT